MQRTRQLAAIMFTDIQGYTALMQRDEMDAIRIRDTHRAIFDPITEKHHGKIIQYYGDGTLSIFQSAVQAVSCAIEMQIGFRKEGIPVRIGLHLGDIVVSDSDIIGDGVNLASRVESLAVEGSVLVSEKIQAELKSHPSIGTLLMGEFHFKNDDQPRKVFAIDHPGLVVPDGSKLKGKTKLKTQLINFKWLTLVIVFGLLLASGAYYFSKVDFNKDSFSFKNSRVAIVPFNNNTNDPSLDIFGEMVADWIISGLSNFEGVKMVNFQSIKDNIALASVNATQNQILIDRTGAEIIISGSYYLDGDSIRVISNWENIHDPFLNRLKDEIGNRNNLPEIVTKLQLRIMTLFDLDEVDKTLISIPPTYNAYKKYQEGNKYFGVDYEKSVRFYKEAIALDSLFLDPYLWTMAAFSNQNLYVKRDSMINFVNTQFGSIPKNKKLWLDFHSTHSFKEKYSIIKQIYNQDPTYFLANYNTGLYAGYLNMPKVAIESFGSIKPKNVILKYPSDYWWYITFAENLIRLEDLKKAESLLDSVPESFVSANAYKLFIMIKRGNDKEVELMINKAEAEGMEWNNLINLYQSVISWYSVLRNKSEVVKWSQRLHSEIEATKEHVKVSAIHEARDYYFMENYRKALGYYMSFIKEYGRIEFLVARIGQCHARLGEVKLAESAVKELRALNTGTALYAIGQIYSMLDQKENAVNFLKMAFEKDCFFALGRYDTDFELVNLFGYEPFEKFVEPKGPS